MLRKLYSLALHCGLLQVEHPLYGDDSDALLDRLPWPQALAWLEYLELEGPLGELRADLRAGHTTAMMLNVNLAKGSTRAKPADFSPWLAHQEKTARAAQAASTPPLAPTTREQFADFLSRVS